MAKLDITDFNHPISAVTFDLFDTLLVSDPTVDLLKMSAKVFSRLLQRDGVELNEEAAAKMFTFPFDRSHPHEFTFFEQRINQFLVSSGIQVHKNAIPQYASDILRSWGSRWNLADDAIHVISELSKSGVSVGLVTNFDHYPHVQELINESELGALFDVVVISSEVGFYKPLMLGYLPVGSLC
jgi:putative hydrolase of the HAD superfamily